jgi:putative membrane protein
MILRKQFDLRIVFRNIRNEVLTTLIVATVIFLLYRFEAIRLGLPFPIVATLGSALAIFIAFRNQSAYSRWWEARTIWGGVINSSRIFARQVVANVQASVSAGKCEKNQASAFAKELVYRQIAFAHALRLHLRREADWEVLQSLLEPEEYRALLTAQNKPNMLLLRQGIRIREGIAADMLNPFDNMTMEQNLATFNNWQGACERIKNTPLLRNYYYFTRLFLYVFIVVLPFCLANDFARINAEWLIIPVSFIICFVFAVMNRVGEVNEDPFENDIHDVPMTALCNTIERDLKEQLGEIDLPVKAEPVNGFLF